MITSDLGGMRELVKDGIDGWTFPPGDVNSLSRIIRDIDADPTVLDDLRPSPDIVRDIRDDAEELVRSFRRLLDA